MSAICFFSNLSETSISGAVLEVKVIFFFLSRRNIRAVGESKPFSSRCLPAQTGFQITLVGKNRAKLGIQNHRVTDPFCVAVGVNKAPVFVILAHTLHDKLDRVLMPLAEQGENTHTLRRCGNLLGKAHKGIRETVRGNTQNQGVAGDDALRADYNQSMCSHVLSLAFLEIQYT